MKDRIIYVVKSKKVERDIVKMLWDACEYVAIFLTILGIMFSELELALTGDITDVFIALAMGCATVGLHIMKGWFVNG